MKIAQFLGLRAIGHRSCVAASGSYVIFFLSLGEDVESEEVAFGHHQFEIFGRGEKGSNAEIAERIKLYQ